MPKKMSKKKKGARGDLYNWDKLLLQYSDLKPSYEQFYHVKSRQVIIILVKIRTA